MFVSETSGFVLRRANGNDKWPWMGRTDIRDGRDSSVFSSMKDEPKMAMGTTSKVACDTGGVGTEFLKDRFEGFVSRFTVDASETGKFEVVFDVIDVCE